MLADRRILLIISGGIAAYKSLDLIRRLRERGATVRAVMTEAAQAFVTPLAVGALTGTKVHLGLFDQNDEYDIGHIRLARESDLIVIAPATADLLGRMAHGLASDLATAILLATKTPVLVAPAMNPQMWANAATQRNVATLRADGVRFVGPAAGEMAERGEAGLGRMAEPLDIVAACEELLRGPTGSLAGRRILVTAGPTHEPIDPVRFIANRSSGRQGYAIAAAAARAGAEVVLVSGPVALVPPPGIEVVQVETATEMAEAVQKALPVDVAVMAAAVGDWRMAEQSAQKLKKEAGPAPRLALIANEDILAAVGHHATLRPTLVIGFAAETTDLLENAKAKREKKGADWIVANDVSPGTGVMGGADNTVFIVKPDAVLEWERMNKADVAGRLVALIAEALETR